DPANGWKGLLLSPTPRGVGGRAASFPTRIPPVTLVKHGRAFPAAENAGYAGASSGKPWVQRRRFLGLMGRGVALVAGLGLSDGSALARTKVTKEAADYQDSPKSGQQCSECQFWQGANICSRVKGPISPQGWCALYKPKAEPKS
ncbi:MAG TPA: high-potential iron-sulfur protein, partial [Gammaproteobacteria bacterium]|nr:high-potential iron-sulfur protein [Gammaproteobacteria bacterium]